MTSPPQRAGRREWIGLAVIALPCLVYSMDLTVLNLALPEISRDLRPSSSELLWIVDIYGFLVAGALITMGTLGDWIARFSAGAAIGPLVGGALLELFWWGSVFLIAVPVMALLLVLGPRLLPESRDADAGRLDVGSAALSLGAVLAVIFGLKRFAEDGFAWAPAGAVVAGVAFAALFARRQARLADPLIDLGLFRIRAFSAGLATNTLGFFAAFGLFVLVAQYLQLVLGLSPLEAGLWSLPSAFGFIAGAMAGPALLAGVRPALVIAGGLALAAVGFVLFAPARGVAG